MEETKNPNSLNYRKEWRALVLNRLDKIEHNQVEMKVSIAALKVKAGIWGFLGGFGPAAIIVILWLLRTL